MAVAQSVGFFQYKRYWDLPTGSACPVFTKLSNSSLAIPPLTLPTQFNTCIYLIASTGYSSVGKGGGILKLVHVQGKDSMGFRVANDQISPKFLLLPPRLLMDLLSTPIIKIL